MDKTFEKFLRSGIDLSLIGIERREDNASYFCTPKGASIFGWAGVDGIHYCFVRGFGGMVFAVSPMNSAPDFVHPIARDFEDFLRLLLACGDVSSIINTTPKTNNHTWDSGVVTTEPTAEKEGVKTYTCKVCNETKTETIPRLNGSGK